MSKKRRKSSRKARKQDHKSLISFVIIAVIVIVASIGFAMLSSPSDSEMNSVTGEVSGSKTTLRCKTYEIKCGEKCYDMGEYNKCSESGEPCKKNEGICGDKCYDPDFHQCLNYYRSTLLKR